MSTYTPPPYNLLPIKRQPLESPPKDDTYNPQTAITNLLTLAETIQVETSEATFTSWRNQLATAVDALVEHAHLLKPSDLITLLTDGIAAPLEHIKGLQTEKTSLCFPGRCQRISDLASGLAAHLRKELREGKIRALDSASTTSVSTVGDDTDTYHERGILSLVKAWFSWKQGESGSVTIHPALTVSISMLSAAIGHLSLHEDRNAFAYTMKEVDVAGWEEYSTDDDGYLGAFWEGVLPGMEEREGCGCARCRSYLMMLVGWRLTCGKYGVLHTPFF